MSWWLTDVDGGQNYTEINIFLFKLKAQKDCQMLSKLHDPRRNSWSSDPEATALHHNLFNVF